MKKCPYCAEEIQDEAIKCRYCLSDLTRVKTANESESKQDKSKEAILRVEEGDLVVYPRVTKDKNGHWHQTHPSSEQVEVSKITEQTPPRPSPQRSSVTTPAPEKTRTKVISYAGFWKRVAACLIDIIITTIGLIAVIIWFGIMFGGGTLDAKTWERMGSFIGLIGCWLYYALMESSPKQATLGKMALKIKVTDLNGSKIDFGKATGRYFGMIISAFILCIGFIMVAFTQKKQGLHDIMAGCLVVNSDTETVISYDTVKEKMLGKNDNSSLKQINTGQVPETPSTQPAQVSREQTTRSESRTRVENYVVGAIVVLAILTFVFLIASDYIKSDSSTNSRSSTYEKPVADTNETPAPGYAQLPTLAGTAEEWNKEGFKLEKSGNYTDAVKAFSKAIELNPQDANAYSHRGFAYGELGIQQQAIKDYDKAIELNPRSATLYSNRGNAYGALGMQQQAINDYNKTIELNPQYADAYVNRGVAYGKLGNYQQAIKNYDKAIELNPQFAIAYCSRGNAYGALGMQQQAIKDNNKAIELNPQFANAYASRGVAYYNLGNYQQAITDSSKAIELNPQYAIAYSNRGNAYDALGNTQRAIEEQKIAARLEHKWSQDFLKSKGIEW